MNAGIYIHVPFCRSKCSYCSFVSGRGDQVLMERYCRALVRELHVFAESAAVRTIVETIYLGGGTPSLLAPEQIEALLKTCREVFDVVPECEISMEANPGTLRPEDLRSCRSLGVNRISLGAQSFSDVELAAIGRIHKAREIRMSWELLRACGYSNLNLDLILGLPLQSRCSWRANLESAAALTPDHVSVYMLELDPKVPLYRAVEQGRCRIADDDAVADWYLNTIDFLAGRGLAQYEISNFARHGCECRHNLKYWRCEPVLAFGVAAHSYDGVSRYANTADLPAYLSAIEEGRSPVKWRLPHDRVRELEEKIFLGLRLNRGLDWDGVRRNFAPHLVASCETSVQEMADQGLLEWENSILRLTRRGMLLSNEVFQKFVTL